MLRVLGIDYGLRRTGLAIGEMDDADPSNGGGMALPFEMFEGLPDPQLAQAIADLVRRELVTQIVIGMPLNADGSVSQQSKITERFVLTLTQHVSPTVPIERVSEFLSTHHAEGKLAGHYTRQQKRQRVDALAAAGLLQDWMDQQKGRGRAG
jgi:putative Holliday junction resolvase